MLNYCKLNDVNIDSFYQILALKSSRLSSFTSEWSLCSNSLLHNNPIEGEEQLSGSAGTA